MGPRAHRVPVPDRARELAGLPGATYADAFEVARPAGDTRQPERIAAQLLLTMPTLVPLIRVAQASVGLHLAAGDAPGHLLGWRIAHSDADACLLTTPDGPGTGRIVLLGTSDTLAVATLLRLSRRGVTVWTAVAPVHRRVACVLLARAARAARPGVAVR